MNKNIAIIIVLIIGVVVALYVAVNQAGNESMTTKETSQNEDDQMMMEEDKMMEMEEETTGDTMSKEEMMMTASGYETYSAEKLAFASDGKVVLFFRASWCPSCIALDRDIRSSLHSIPTDVLILDVNYDTATALRQQYGVTYQHTFVQVDAEGNLIKKWSGGETLEKLLAEIE